MHRIIHLKASLAFLVVFLVKFSISEELTLPTKEKDTHFDSYSLKSEFSSNKVESSPESHYSPAQSTVETTKKEASGEKRYHVAKFDFDHVAAPFIITAWIFAACCAKIGM